MAMKKLFLLRHAHSTNSIPDFKRELNDIGINKCQELAVILAPYSNNIDYILSSSSIRTSQTICNSLPNREVHYSDDCYNASSEELLMKLQGLDPKYNFIILVAHNPGISELASLFSEDIVSFSPGNLALFDCSIDSWHELGLRNTKLLEFWP
jgi:phosphohistidine phosphatase